MRKPKDLSAEYALADAQEKIERLNVAYDLDKVVEQLDKASDYYECEEQGRWLSEQKRNHRVS